MKYYAFLFISLILTSCAEPEQSCNDNNLIKVASMYLNAEKNKDWDSTYKLRYKEFKESVPVGVYVDQMNKDSSGWKMINYELGEFKISSKKAEVLVKIKEEVPIKLRINKKSSIAFKGTIKFLCKNGEWLVFDAPSRNHYSLNSAIVPLN